MNMALHGVEGANVSYRDSLAEDHAEDAGRYSLVLANPPFAGALDYEATAKDLQRIVKTRKTELLFVALFLRLLKTGGRAAVIVPDGGCRENGFLLVANRYLCTFSGRVGGALRCRPR